MRSRRSSQEQVAEVARRRLELLSAELAAIRPGPEYPPLPGDRGGSGERPDRVPSGPSARTDPIGATGFGGPGRHAHRPVGLGASVAGWAQDRLPATVQGRVRLSGAHLAVVAVAVLAGVALTAWWVARADGGSSPVSTVPPPATRPSTLVTASGPAASPPGSAGPSGGAGPAAAATAAGPGAGPAGGQLAGDRIVVDVTGKVRQPGIATLSSGARVVDALEAAGGARPGVSLASLNLARVLADGEQIVVGVRGPPGVAASAASSTGSSGTVGGTVGGVGSGGASPVSMVNVNTADQIQLEALPEVGPVTARAILDYRTEKGGFTSVDELLEVSGIGDATLARIAPYCTL